MDKVNNRDETVVSQEVIDIGTLNDKIRGSLEPVIDKITDIIATQIESGEVESPIVGYCDDVGGDECLYINGKEVMRHKHLYISDVLNALEEAEIILVKEY